MSEEFNATQKPVMRSEISRYAYGGFGVNIVSSLFASFAVYFMTDVAGLNVAVAGIVSGVALFFDAVTDVLLGAICDKTVTKMGRYRPYILCGCLILALGALISFTTVPFAGGAKVLYYIFAFCLFKLGSTLVLVPYNALPVIMSSDRAMRNRIVLWAHLAQIPAVVIALFAHNIVAALGGENEAKGWFLLVLIASANMALAMLLCFLGVKRFDTKEKAEKATKAENGERISLGKVFKALKGNKALYCLILAYGTNICANSFMSANQSFYSKYVLQDLGFVSRAALVIGAITIPTFILSNLLTKKISKRNLFIIATIIEMAGAVLLLIGNNAYNGTVALIAISIARTGGLACAILMAMMLPDCVDYGYKLTGFAAAGLITSFMTFADKAGSTLGNIVSTAMLNSAGYVANAEQSPKVLSMLILLMSVPFVISDICSLVGMWLYPIRDVDGKIKSKV